jgi:hypothetical protein
MGRTAAVIWKGPEREAQEVQFLSTNAHMMTGILECAKNAQWFPGLSK